MIQLGLFPAIVARLAFLSLHARSLFCLQCVDFVRSRDTVFMVFDTLSFWCSLQSLVLLTGSARLLADAIWICGTSAKCPFIPSLLGLFLGFATLPAACCSFPPPVFVARKCQEDECVDGLWGLWQEWEPCSSTCKGWCLRLPVFAMSPFIAFIVYVSCHVQVESRGACGRLLGTPASAGRRTPDLTCQLTTRVDSSQLWAARGGRVAAPRQLQRRPGAAPRSISTFAKWRES